MAIAFPRSDHRVFFLIAAAVLPAACAAGCRPAGEPLWPVAGRVTLNREPVEGVSLRFTAARGEPDMIAPVRPDGTYEVVMARGAGLPRGDYAVTVIPTPISSIGPAPKPAAPRKQSAIPAKYARAATSGLTLTVEPRSNRFDVDLR